jgi:hypothetical protein
MKTVHIAGLMLAAGVFGFLAGGVAGVVSSPEPKTADTVLLDRLTGIAKGVDALRDAAAENRNAVADVRERVVAVELEMDRRKNAPPVAEASDPIKMPIVVRGGPGLIAERGSPGDDPVKVAARLGDMRAAADAAAKAADGLQARFAKTMKIRAMPEDERWEYAAETLGLNSVQVDELRAAQETMNEAMKEATTSTTTTTESGSTMVFRQVDGNKMAEARKAFGERVDTVLNDEQKKAWNDEGFGSAMGGGPGSHRIRLSGGVRMSSDGAGSAREIEIVEAETIEIEVDDE